VRRWEATVLGFTLSVCHAEPDASSRSTISPTEYPAALDSWTEYERIPMSTIDADGKVRHSQAKIVVLNSN
jgi:hypothetical protein